MDPHPLETRATRHHPTDSEREALETVNRLLFKYDHNPGYGVREFEAQLRAAGFRLQGPVTDAEVEAAAKALYGPDGIGYSREMDAVRVFYRTQARAALEAARAVR